MKEFTRNEIEVAGCLRRLLKNRFILRATNEKWFQAMIDHRVALQSLFQKMFFQVEINETLGLIYLKPESDEIEERINFQMHKRKSLTKLGSLLAMYLRKERLQFYMNPSNNEIPLVSSNDLREFLQTFNQLKIDSQFERMFRKSIEEITDHQLIRETESESGYYEITPICEVLLPADTLNEYSIKIKKYLEKNNNLKQEPEVYDA